MPDIAKVHALVHGMLAWVKNHPRVFLTFVCLLLWAPGIFSLPPLDRDESRFAQSSKQMVESGNFVDIRLGTEPRYKKPVGIYWMQAATTTLADSLTGNTVHNRIWTYRLTSLAGALASVWLTYWIAEFIGGAEVAFLAGLLLAMTLLLTGEANIAKTDAVLLACILGGQGYFLNVYARAREGGGPAPWGAHVLGWGALGLGALVKGPMALPVSGLTLLALCLWDRKAGWIKNIRPLSGLALVLLMVLPWAIAIGLVSHGGFYQQSLGQDFVGKLAGGQESHGAAPGYYLALLPLTFWPATLFLLPGLGEAVRQRAVPAVRFLICWIVPSWLMFELTPTKLPHYVLPVYPALAILAAIWMVRIKSSTETVEPLAAKVLSVVSPVLYGVAALALIGVAVFVPPKFGGGVPIWAMASLTIFAFFIVLSLMAYGRKQVLSATLCTLAGVVILYPTMTGALAPSMSRLWVTPRATAMATALAHPNDPPPILTGYIEPSMLFLLGSDTRLVDGAGAAALAASQGGLVLVEERSRAAFLRGLAEHEANAEEVGTLDGFNYSRGRPVHIRFYRVAPVEDWVEPPPKR